MPKLAFCFGAIRKHGKATGLKIRCLKVRFLLALKFTQLMAPSQTPQTPR